MPPIRKLKAIGTSENERKPIKINYTQKSRFCILVNSSENYHQLTWLEYGKLYQKNLLVRFKRKQKGLI